MFGQFLIIFQHYFVIMINFPHFLSFFYTIFSGFNFFFNTSNQFLPNSFSWFLISFLHFLHLTVNFSTNFQRFFITFCTFWDKNHFFFNFESIYLFFNIFLHFWSSFHTFHLFSSNFYQIFDDFLRFLIFTQFNIWNMNNLSITCPIKNWSFRVQQSQKIRTSWFLLKNVSEKIRSSLRFFLCPVTQLERF